MDGGNRDEWTLPATGTCGVKSLSVEDEARPAARVRWNAWFRFELEPF